ncbi:LPS-assembly protein LptD [Caldimonas sp. KR1-144]|uniref:LPS-assembly protein LptD n=1 Tax=Caldimonas sp. KR1-144 TaxID=3400911 RepID=UPI003C04B40A
MLRPHAVLAPHRDRRHASAPRRWRPVAFAALIACVDAGAQSAPTAPASEPAAASTPAERPSGASVAPTLRSGARDAGLPVVIEADRLYGTPDLESVAEGHVEMRRGLLKLKADRVAYRQPEDLVRASGSVVIESQGNVFRGPELALNLTRFEGYFVEPTYFFSRMQAGGHAERFNFLGENRGEAIRATYTSCPAEDPAWILSTDKVTLDIDANEGRAEGGVLRFMGVPILAAPVLSFPLTDERKSGWLPPNVGVDNKSGFELAVPYYWNIAPNRDATITPTVMTRRGFGAAGEFRFLEPGARGTVQVFGLPNDREANRDRWSLNLDQRGEWQAGPAGEIGYAWMQQRASDKDYWKDFSEGLPSLTPRLLPTDASAVRRFRTDWGETQAYARVQRWQVLQETDLSARIVAPYEREPQVGLRQIGSAGGLEWRWETEANRFRNEDTSLQQGSRVHALGSLAYPLYPLGTPSWVVTPRASFNAAAYDVDQPMADGRTRASRFIPTVSLDSRWVFERETSAFGRQITQTLEPRLLYVNTPYRSQSILPNFDAAANDYNFTSVFAENPFSGVDRVADVHQITAGVTTRYLDRETGAEALRLGIAQRLLLRDQRVTPDDEPITQRWSDLLLLGATNVVPNWWLDGTLQYNSEINRSVRSVLGARYSPGPLRTINASYRFTRDSTEQIEVGWQWPLNAEGRQYASELLARDQAARDGSVPARITPSANCAGAWYTVGRVNFSKRDSRITDALVGFEYDAGCWIGRIVAERLSTGRSEATTRLMFQLELVGLSRLGSNPLSTLRDNIPGYRLLRDDAAPAASSLTLP